ncbi:RNA pyrophosphohydrolase [Pseudomonadales bacterium]|nr:RNA pyrophosphohydrolase [Pseudomonadales bacterium]
MIDEQGYRPNVCIVIANSAGQVFWGKRRQQSAWQFPQGGIEAGESIEAALYRELQEETGLVAEQVQLIAVTKPWYRYRLPKHMLKNNQSNYVGQKQKYGLLKILDDAHQFVLDQDRHPEFDDWAWVPYWYPVGTVWAPKQDAYRRALKELAPFLKQCLPEVKNRARSTS